MSIRVIVNGANGKMGQLTVKTLSAHPDFTVVGSMQKDSDLGQEIKRHKAEVVVDFTNAHSVFSNLTAIIEAGACPVIGTSGLMENEVQAFQAQCKQRQLGGVIAPNFSIGALLMMKYAEEIVRYFPRVEIIEMHHAGKLDSPSGTAMRTAERLAKSRTQVPPSLPTARETISGARGANYQQVPIHAVRLPGFLASQQVIFGGPGETLSLRHDTIDRECFMPGVVLACQKVVGLKELVYGLEHLL